MKVDTLFELNAFFMYKNLIRCGHQNSEVLFSTYEHFNLFIYLFSDSIS